MEKGKNGKVGFDFGKKPKSPSFLMNLAKWIISWPDLKKRNFTLEKRNLEQVEGPYLLLVTHSSMVDFNVMLKVTHPQKVNNVMTLEGFRDYTEPLMRSLGVLGTRKFVTDLKLIRNMKYCIEELHNTFVLFPEARYSLDGCTSYLPDSLGKLVRLLGVPVVVLRIHGNFVTCPQWNKKNKKTHVEAEMIGLLTQEQAKTMPVEEINARIAEEFVYDDYRWQLEHKIFIGDKKRADGLHRLLYKCPACQREGDMMSGGIRLWCRNCGKTWEQDEYGQLHGVNGETEFSHIPDWSNWERACVRQELEEGRYYFEDQVQVETLPNLRFYKKGSGRLIQTATETRIEYEEHGQPCTIVRSASGMNSIHIEYDYHNRGDCVDISVSDNSYWCYLSKRDVLTKLSFATEEMHKMAKAAAKKESAGGMEKSLDRRKRNE